VEFELVQPVPASNATIIDKNNAEMRWPWPMIDGVYRSGLSFSFLRRFTTGWNLRGYL